MDATAALLCDRGQQYIRCTPKVPGRYDSSKLYSYVFIIS